MASIVRLAKDVCGDFQGFECSDCRNYLGYERICNTLRYREPKAEQDMCPYCREPFEGITFVTEFSPQRFAEAMGYL